MSGSRCDVAASSEKPNKMKCTALTHKEKKQFDDSELKFLKSPSVSLFLKLSMIILKTFCFEMHTGSVTQLISSPKKTVTKCLILIP